MSGTVILTGGVGGAKLVLGLVQIVPAETVTAIVNTGDDFRHLGLHISPDIDTLLYTLAGKANRQQGWGREGESWAFQSTLAELGGEDWFLLGDKDMALHVLRSAALAQGDTLSAVTARIARRWDIGATILPMSDDPVATIVDSDIGPLEFQRYFVERRCAPVVHAIRFAGSEHAVPAPGVLETILVADIILIAPSNPFLSVDPLLAIPALRRALIDARAPVVAVSPLIGGKAVKGPTAKLMDELGLPVNNDTIAAHYAGIIDGLLIHSDDSCTAPGIVIDRAPTLMITLDDKAHVAGAAMALAARLG